MPYAFHVKSRYASKKGQLEFDNEEVEKSKSTLYINFRSSYEIIRLYLNIIVRHLGVANFNSFFLYIIIRIFTVMCNMPR